MHGAVIVETRVIPNLGSIILSHIKYLPDDWGLTIYCSKDNYNLVSFLEKYDDIEIIVLPQKNFGINEYNKLLTSLQFWMSLPYEKVLVFQSDSMLLREGIEDFLMWDYVGAPWKFQEHGGNGGLSLRDNKVMQHLCYKYKFTDRNEDAQLCNLMKEHNIGNLAPREICQKFSCETIFCLETLGYHAIDAWLTEKECNLIKLQYKNA